MGAAIAIGLILIAALLFLVAKKGLISDITLGRLANIAGIVALLAAAIAFIFVSSSSPNGTDVSLSATLAILETRQADLIKQLTAVPTERSTLVHGTPDAVSANLEATLAAVQAEKKALEATIAALPTPARGGRGRIAFATHKDGNVEIYAMNADGSSQANLTRNRAYDWGPNWSPDGRHLAFASDRDGNLEIYAMDSDGSNQLRLTSNTVYDSSPVWSPDGSKIAFKSLRGSYEIYLMNVNGTGLTHLVSNVSGDWRISWSPDGKRIAFTS